MTIKVGMISLGCSKNQVDAERLLAMLAGDGFTICNDMTECDAVIVNTCGFIEDAKKESIDTILECCAAKGEGSLKCVAVTGCLAERYREELAREIPEADVVLGIGSNGKIGEAIRKAVMGEHFTEYGEKESLSMEGERMLANEPWFAYVKVAEGCDNRCSYCAIPLIRGRFRSRPMENVIEECKELAARAVHECSARCDKPFIAVNCGAIPENLFESEFFGYKKGAFTGALADRKGCLDRADGGTLFLDELGELSLSAQTKLLRAIEGQGFTPVGGSDLHKPNFRIIAATNRNLAERVASGQMREDFFYRIHVIPIHLPPLRQRKEDIPLLIEYFLNAYPRVGDLPALNGEVMQAFMQYDWPGNIRELHNTLYRYLTLGKVQLGTLQVGSGQLPAGGQTGTGEAEHRQALPQEPLASALDRFEREYLLETLRRNDWKRAETADILGIDRRTLFRKIKQFDLEDEEGK